MKHWSDMTENERLGCHVHVLCKIVLVLLARLNLHKTSVTQAEFDVFEAYQLLVSGVKHGKIEVEINPTKPNVLGTIASISGGTNEQV